MPDMPAQVPIAPARSSWRKDDWMIDRAPGVSNAAATPWRMRNATSCVGDWAKAHSALHTAKPATPVR